MKLTPTAERIAEACRGIIRRSDQIVALAETPDAELSRIFSRKEIRVTNGICCELALAVADSESVDDLAANRENFERMREAGQGGAGKGMELDLPTGEGA